MVQKVIETKVQLLFNAVAISLVTGHALQGYRSDNHVNSCIYGRKRPLYMYTYKITSFVHVAFISQQVPGLSGLVQWFIIQFRV